MKVALITLSCSRDAGGLFDCVRRLGQKLSEIDSTKVDVLSLADAHTAADLPAWKPLTIHASPAHFGYAPQMLKDLRNVFPEVAHTIGLWSYPSFATRAWNKESKRPYLISPQGMLDPWALNNSRWKKRLAAWLFEKRHLRSAACLHALCTVEAEAMRTYGLTNPICIIPNGVDLPADGLNGDAPWNGEVPTNRRILLYLGRLHPKKGLVNLLHAWAEATKHDRNGQEPWHLVIAGWDQGGHLEELQKLVGKLSIQDSVSFVGPQFGEDKASAYRSADAFILPSFSEGLPLVVLEAWAYRLPVLMTPECNLPEGFTEDAAIQIEAEPDSIAKGLQTLFTMGADERKQMGSNGRALVERNFTWSKVAEQMHSVYEWVLGRREQPECMTL